MLSFMAWAMNMSLIVTLPPITNLDNFYICGRTGLEVQFVYYVKSVWNMVDLEQFINVIKNVWEGGDVIA